MMVEKAFYLTEADLKTIKEYLKVSDDRRGNSPSKHQPQEGYLTPEVYMAYAGSGIPAIGGTNTGSGTNYSPGSASCNIYSINLTTGYLQQVQNVTKTVYNLSSTAVPTGWVVIQRDKFGNWLVGLGASSSGSSGGGATGQCNCFNCITPAQASVGGCSNCPDGAPYQYQVSFGNWTAYPQIAGTQYLTYDHGCYWYSPQIFCAGSGLGTGSPDLGTGSPGGGGYYQWQLYINGINSTLSLINTSGNNPLGI